jgi:endonuclease/exonuclease/phosphatase family metal-dependent hydrolase
MHTELRVLNWNLAGAKYFSIHGGDEKEAFKLGINDAIAELVHRHDPHVVTLQEIVVVARPGESLTPLVVAPEGYKLAYSILIDSGRHPYVAKWRNVTKQGNWPPDTYFGQGLGMLWKTDLPQLRHFPVWRIPDATVVADGDAHIEEVILMSGMYFGDRNTEPRAALVAHFVITQDLKNTPTRFSKPLDVFVVNLHLTTLKNEREGIPSIDAEAAATRAHQLDIILNGIVSRYNLWRSDGYRTGGERPPVNSGEDPDRYSPVWILCGDFNLTPESDEYQRLQRANFVDVCPAKGQGNKASGFGTRARLTVDYIFAGPKFVSLDPVIVDDAIKGGMTPEYWVKVSDHYPIFAQVPLTPR